MDYFQLTFAFILSVFVSSASGALATGGYTWGSSGNPISPDLLSACTAYVSSLHNSNYNTPSVSSNACYAKFNTSPPSFLVNLYYFPCASGSVVVGTSCVANNCPPVGGTVGDNNSVWGTTGNIPGASVCQGGCQYSLGGILPSVCANGNCYGFGKLTSTKTPCSGTATVPNVSQPSDSASLCAKQGKVPGMVNGVVVCVKPDTSTTVKSSSSAASGVDTSASGVTTNKGSTIGESTTTTTCAGSNCRQQTTTKVTNPDGSKSEVTSDSFVDKGSFCKDNPNDTQCKADSNSSWGGACGAFSCDGDAIQCAIAQASWKEACNTDVSGSEDHYSSGDSALAGVDKFKDSEVSATFSLDGYINQNSNLGPQSSCPDDVVIPLPGGQTYSVPFSRYCSTLNAVGLAGNGLSMIAALLIVFGGSSSRKD